MAKLDDPARQLLGEHYRTAIDQGRAVTLKWLADNSRELVGISVSHETIKSWSSEDQWASYLATSLSPDLADTKTLFDNAKDDLLNKRDSWKAVANSARAVVALAKGIPDAYSLLIENDISECYEAVNRMLLESWDDIDGTHRTTLVTCRGQLNKMMPQDVTVQVDGVSPDAALLQERAR